MVAEIEELEAKREELKAEVSRLYGKIKNQEAKLKQITEANKLMWERLKRMERNGLL